MSANSESSASNQKPNKTSTRKYFTAEEDIKLLELIKKYNFDWKKISNEMNNRTVRQCKDRYHHYLSPDICREKWTHDEDNLLLSTVEAQGKKWKLFENIFTGRTEIDIRNRYNILMRRINKETQKPEINPCNEQYINEKKEDNFVYPINTSQSENIEKQQDNEKETDLFIEDLEVNDMDKVFGMDLGINSFDDFLSELYFY